MVVKIYSPSLSSPSTCFSSFGRPSIVLTFSSGQSRRWAPVGFFVRWWGVVLSSFSFVAVDTNRAPHDYWLTDSSVFFSSLFNF